jgi:hypothetical protein
MGLARAIFLQRFHQRLVFFIRFRNGLHFLPRLIDVEEPDLFGFAACFEREVGMQAPEFGKELLLFLRY